MPCVTTLWPENTQETPARFGNRVTSEILPGWERTRWSPREGANRWIKICSQWWPSGLPKWTDPQKSQRHFVGSAKRRTKSCNFPVSSKKIQKTQKGTPPPRNLVSPWFFPFFCWFEIKSNPRTWASMRRIGTYQSRLLPQSVVTFVLHRTPKAYPFRDPKAFPFRAPKASPFRAPKAYPFRAPKAFPFRAPKASPFRAPKTDPFRAPKASSFGPRKRTVSGPESVPFSGHCRN